VAAGDPSRGRNAPLPIRELDDPQAWALDTFQVPPGTLGDRAVVVNGPEGHHAVDVVRVRPGDVVRLIDGEGSEALARVDRAVRSEATLSIIESRTRRREEGIELTIAQALLKGKGFGECVRRSSELGVARIVPLVTERTVGKLPPEDGGARLDRWRGIALAAVKQSRGIFVPAIDAVLGIDDLGPVVADADLALVAWEEEGTTALRDVLKGSGPVRRIVLIVGPEGGLTRAEVDSLREAGASTVGLGARILKADWAAAAAAAMISYELGGLLP